MAINDTAAVARTWLVRCEGGELFDDFVEGGFVALGGNRPAPDLTGVRTRSDIETRVRQCNRTDWRAAHVVGVFTRFALEMQVGDRVLTYDPSQRVYAVGRITGPYRHDRSRMEGKQHFRDVQWEPRRIARDDLSAATRQSLASMVTVFAPSNAAAGEVDALLRGVEAGEDTSPVEAESIEFRNLTDQARELVKDRVVTLSWDQMQELVAGVLRAMGYKTRISPPGADRGRDILASPDGLGLEHPRILVEVKHRPNTAISGPDVRSFVGGLQSSDRGLFVSTGGFTKDAKYEADRSSTPLTLLDIDELVKLLLEHYEKADARLRTLIPLVPVYWPATT